jgi:hypothetical protein
VTVDDLRNHPLAELKTILDGFVDATAEEAIVKQVIDIRDEIDRLRNGRATLTSRKKTLEALSQVGAVYQEYGSIGLVGIDERIIQMAEQLSGVQSGIQSLHDELDLLLFGANMMNHAW